MSFALLAALVLVTGLSLFATLSRRLELRRMRATLQAQERAVDAGDRAARLQVPVIDLSRCLGCATCVAVCPEQGVLEIVHGQAVVVNGARCQGITACERECPTGAITVAVAEADTRDDIPAVDDALEAIGAPGLFLAGEVTARALVRVAVEHGTRIAATVAGRRDAVSADPAVLDLCIVGAGPAGLGCALEATRHGLDFVVLEQEATLGGTVAKYPRQKLVLTQPIDLPLVGRLRRATYTKEQLIAIWEGAANDHALPIETSVRFERVERGADGTFTIHSGGRTWRARYVCFAIGRRGSPRRLDVPGEDAPHVAFALLDAHTWRDQRLVVVGGGDSAVETALALAEQPGNTVTLVHRRDAFVRIRARNASRLDAAVAAGTIRVALRATVTAIHRDHVAVAVADGADNPTTSRVPADAVFVMIGGTPPVPLLAQAGVSFDPALRPQAAPLAERGTGIVPAVAIAFVTSLLALGFAAWHGDYYGLPAELRPTHPKHVDLRPGHGVGLALGIAAAGLVVANLTYLLRRGRRLGLRFGSLSAWMTGHVATGVLAVLCAVLHAALAPRDTPGGNALWALVVLLGTGAVGRYLYAWVPRAANGRELELADLKARLAQLTRTAAHGTFGAKALATVEAVVERRQWRGTFAGRLLALCGVRLDLHRALRRLDADARAHGVDAATLGAVRALARDTHAVALAAAHYEDLRAVLASWRYLHRWIAVLMVVLIVVHVVYALAYGTRFAERGGL